jgi:hypothetical protein
MGVIKSKYFEERGYIKHENGQRVQRKRCKKNTWKIVKPNIRNTDRKLHQSASTAATRFPEAAK